MKYPIGTRVILKSKFGSIDQLENFSSVYDTIIENDFKCGIIVGYADVDDSFIIRENSYIISYDENMKTGDYFYEEDVELYVPYYRKLKLQKIYEHW